MKIFKPYFLFFLLVFILSHSNGCATLPNVSEVIDGAPTARETMAENVTIVFIVM